MTRLALLLVLAASPAVSAPLSAVQAADALATEHLRCAASYSLGLRCFKDKLDASATQDFRRARDLALTRGYAYGRKAGLSDEALLARTDGAMQSVRGEAQECGALPAMLPTYGRSCKALVQDPDARLRRLTGGGR